MRTPAALPLIALIAGLALGPLLVNPQWAMCGLLAITLLRPRTFTWFAIAGIALALHVQSRDTAEREAFAKLDPDRFVIIEVPLERDWAELDGTRARSFVLRASRFRANDIPFETPIAAYARFEPPEMTMERVLRAEGFLRLSERGEYSVSIKSEALMTYEGALPRWHPRAWNRALANRLERHAGARGDEVALAQALILGRGERLTTALRDSFRRGGTYHLLVFSGLQIAFAAGLLAALLRWLHRPRASDWLLLAFATIAPLFIGPTASVSRASIGIALYALSRILKRPTSLENLWCLAALLRLLVEPRDLADASFHLTYAGAGALLFIGRHLSERRWLGHLLGVEIAIAPLTLFHFHQYVLGGSLVTLAMSPLIVAMLVVSMFACAFPPLLGVIGMLHRWCVALNRFGVSGYFAAPPLVVLIASAFCALFAIALLRERRRAVAIAVALLVPIAASVVRSVSQRSVADPRVTFFDVGQGDAIAIRARDRTIVVDGGRDLRLLPLLADRGVRRIDAVVLTHAHPDHCAALPALVENFRVERVYVSPRRFRGDCATRLLDACSRSRTPIHPIHDGDTFAIPLVHFEAHMAGHTFRRAPENNASVVLLVTIANRRFLLTGDIEKEAELTLADRDLRADVLKVPHHGSRTSSSETLLDLVAPRIAVISCGRRNLFGHPHAEVMNALEGRRVRVRRTDQDGSVDVEVRGERLYARYGKY